VGADEGPVAPDEDPEGPITAHRRRRSRIVEDMGGADRIAQLHAQGKRTAREHLAALCDPGSFEELGTFAVSERPDDRASTPGDGKIAGAALIDGRPVGLVVDDVTVKRATSSLVGARKIRRVYDQALRGGHPFVYIGETGGARIPDTLSAEGYASEPVFPWLAGRRRQIPVATAVVGDSFGGSSFIAGMSDFVVMTRRATLAVTSPRVVEVATGEVVTMEDLGGADVHERTTGQVSLVVDDDQQACDAIRRFLSYLPPNAWSAPPRAGAGDGAARPAPDPGLAALVPRRRTQAYDMRTVVERIVDAGTWMELRPRFGRSLLTGLARIHGHAVGVIASQPAYEAGTLGPDACDKAVQLLCTCDAFNLPVVFLQDTPGFLVGRRAEHGRVLHKAMLLIEALTLAGVPRLTVVVRKAFGLAYFALGGSGQGSDLLVAWPGAEIGFMDPVAGANALHGGELAALGEPERARRLGELADGLRTATDPYQVAGAMQLDEIIDPATTRSVLAGALERHAGLPRSPGADRPLAAWPTGW